MCACSGFWNCRFSLSDVGYGDVSSYTPLPDGEYAISMIAAGSGDWSKLAISGTVSVAADHRDDCRGLRAERRTAASSPSPTTWQHPAAGNAKIRLIQASTITPTVDVTTTTGVPIAEDARAPDRRPPTPRFPRASGR